MKTILALVLVVSTGCVDLDSGQDLADGNFDVSFEMDQANAGLLVVTLDRPRDGSGVATTDCMVVHDATTITVNGERGTLANPGGLPFLADSCDSVVLRAPYDASLGVAEIVLGDSSTELHFKLVQDSFRKYQVVRCDAPNCSVFE